VRFLFVFILFSSMAFAENGGDSLSLADFDFQANVALPAVNSEVKEEVPVLSGPLSNQDVLIGRLVLNDLIPLSGGNVPPQAAYQNGLFRVGEILATASETGSENIYEVMLFAPSSDETGVDQKPVRIPGRFSLTESQIRGLMGLSAADQADIGLTNVVNRRYTTAIDCDRFAGFTNETSYREQAAVRAQAPLSPPLAPERYERGQRDPSGSAPTYSGTDLPQANFASGQTTAVGDGTGLVNRRENDPNASQETPGCESLSATEVERQGNPDLEMNEENLTRCIESIQDFILRGVSQPPSVDDRALVFRRLFDLPNHEQEFAAAIFTADGEAGGESNPLDIIMVLKVLSNRRDNANGVEAELQTCRDNHPAGPERVACFGEANRESVFNLLDVALDRLQFSMYNSGDGGNWDERFGHKQPGQFRSSINAFLAYSGVESFTVEGNSNASINNIYHYHTPESRPRWRDESKMLRIRGTHETLGELSPTTGHVFYFNHDNGGSPRGDGWYRNVRHEFRSFP
ncbi:MAG: hypothetical protein K9K67_10210, partial [Bacteriovoracaceae bacterium]|nr:hypothetical protein [Bacteriovoracaceae bacterium]